VQARILREVHDGGNREYLHANPIYTWRNHAWT